VQDTTKIVFFLLNKNGGYTATFETATLYGSKLDYKNISLTLAGVINVNDSKLYKP